MRNPSLTGAGWLAHLLWSSLAYGNAELVERASNPAPISVSPTEAFDGNDGPWSSFFVQVGTPAQALRVLVSTAISTTWVIISAGCPASVTTCPNGRGGIYNPNSSSTWSLQGAYELYVEQNLDIIEAGRFGNDTITLGNQGSGGPTLQKQIVGGIAAQQFWLGMFGVNPKPTNFTSIGENQASYMTTLKDQNLIPSVSFGYTAGNQYRLKTVLGSLTLGGYDSARFSSNNVSFTFAPDDSRDLVVGVQAIKYIDESEHTQDLLDNDAGILAYVDSTIAELWLPESSCKAFEDAFGLVYDTVNQLYPINSTWHSTLKARNPNVTFTLGSEVSGGPTLDIVLPYSAFDLEASWPKYPNNTLYFPLQRAANETQYTLGRTLLQEAYLIVDWERGNFSLSQCVWPDNLGSTIVPIYSPTYGTNSTNSSPQSGSNTTSNNGNNTIAIAVGVALGILVLVSTIAVYLIIRHRKSQNAKRTGPKGKAELDNDGEHPRYEAPGSQTQKSVSESTQLLTLPPPFNDKEILGPHPAFASSAPSITVSELRSEGHTRSPSGSTYHRHEMYGSEFVPIELPASSAQAQELLGSSPEAVHLSDHSSVSSTPLMGALEESNSLIAHSSGASPSKRAQDSSPMNRVASLRGLFNRPGYRRQETMDSIPSLPSRDSPHERGGELFRPISPAGGSAVDAVELQERRDEGRERSNVF